MWKHDYLSAEMTFDKEGKYVNGFLYHSYEVHGKEGIVYKQMASKLDWNHPDEILVEMLKLAAMPGSVRTEKQVLDSKVITIDVRRDRY